MTAAEAFLKHMTQRGLEGDVSAARATIEAIEAHGTQSLASPHTDISEIILSVRGAKPVDRATHLACKIGIAVMLDQFRETVRSALEPWAVEAALARLGDTQIAPTQQRIVWTGTRTPWKVKWPSWWQYRG